jgi:spermidine synthase
MKPHEKLGVARTPNGTLITLYRHDGDYLIVADGVELMSTRRHLSEDTLAELACTPLRNVPAARVLIGGLGLGFTLRSALRLLRHDATLTVAELVAEVIEWNADPGFGLSVDALQDPRVRVVHDDVIAVIRRSAATFDAIMLDTDNGPDGMLISENRSLYSAAGVSATVAALRDGGSIVYWSVADDPRFVTTLRKAGLAVKSVRVRAHGKKGPMHTLYVAVRAK